MSAIHQWIITGMLAVLIAVILYNQADRRDARRYEFVKDAAASGVFDTRTGTIVIIDPESKRFFRVDYIHGTREYVH